LPYWLVYNHYTTNIPYIPNAHEILQAKNSH